MNIHLLIQNWKCVKYFDKPQLKKWVEYWLVIKWGKINEQSYKMSTKYLMEGGDYYILC